jgi:hypothetical protein
MDIARFLCRTMDAKIDRTKVAGSGSLPDELKGDLQSILIRDARGRQIVANGLLDIEREQLGREVGEEFVPTVTGSI